MMAEAPNGAPKSIIEIRPGSGVDTRNLISCRRRNDARLHVIDPARDVVVLNAAAALHVAGEGEMDEAVTTATTSLDSGAALEKLSQLIEAFSAG